MADLVLAHSLLQSLPYNIEKLPQVRASAIVNLFDCHSQRVFMEDILEGVVCLYPVINDLLQLIDLVGQEHHVFNQV